MNRRDVLDALDRATRSVETGDRWSIGRARALRHRAALWGLLADTDRHPEGCFAAQATDEDEAARIETAHQPREDSRR